MYGSMQVLFSFSPYRVIAGDPDTVGYRAFKRPQIVTLYFSEDRCIYVGVMPNFFDLTKYFSVGRTSGVIGIDDKEMIFKQRMAEVFN